MIDFRKRLRIQLSETIYGLRIIDYHSAFMPFALCYQHLSTPWAFRMFWNPLIKQFVYFFCYESGVFSIESPGGSGNWTFAAATLHTFRSDRRKHPVTKVAEQCIFKSRPWITSAQRLSTTPNSRLYDPLKAEILQSQFHVPSQKKLLTPRRCMSFGLCILRQVFCLQHQSQHNCLMPQCPAKHSLEVPGF